MTFDLNIPRKEKKLTVEALDFPLCYSRLVEDCFGFRDSLLNPCYRYLLYLRVILDQIRDFK